jgi:hypothetical protein
LNAKEHFHLVVGNVKGVNLKNEWICFFDRALALKQ